MRNTTFTLSSMPHALCLPKSAIRNSKSEIPIRLAPDFWDYRNTKINNFPFASHKRLMNAIVAKKKVWQGRSTTGSALMIWMVDKKVFQIVINLGFESAKIPVRVKLEFEVKEGNIVPDSLTKSMLYNRHLLERRYPSLDQASLQRSIETKVESEIQKHLQEQGFLEEEK